MTQSKTAAPPEVRSFELRFCCFSFSLCSPSAISAAAKVIPRRPVANDAAAAQDAEYKQRRSWELLGTRLWTRVQGRLVGRPLRGALGTFGSLVKTCKVGFWRT